MSQNRSTAVMQRRRVAPDALDYFPTPPFATRALCAFLMERGEDLPRFSCWEPACGEMHMAHPLAEYFASVRASVVHDYGDNEMLDFALTGFTEPEMDWIISNPPFNLAEDFISTALCKARRGVAMLLRGGFLEADGRYERLFSKVPPAFVLQFVERVAMLEGRLVRIGEIDPFAEKRGTKASSATSYCWFVWMRNWFNDGAWERDTRLRWIAPCRRRLERPGDYPDYTGRLEGDTDPLPLLDGISEQAA